MFIVSVAVEEAGDQLSETCQYIYTGNRRTRAALGSQSLVGCSH